MDSAPASHREVFDHSGGVSVVVPTYNRRRLVCRAIDSVLTQSVAPREVIVVDDGSSDGTSRELARRYRGSIEIVRQPNRGVAAARNAGILAATSELVAFLDSDDEWLPNKLEEQVQIMGDDRVILSFTNWVYATETGHTTHPHRDVPSGFPLAEMRQRNFELIDQPLALLCEGYSGIVLGTCLVRRAALRRVGMFDERMSIAEDTRLLYRLGVEGAFASCAEPLYRIYLDDDRPHSLTHPEDSSYEAKHIAALREILMETYGSTAPLKATERVAVRKVLAEVLAKEGLLFARGKSPDSARPRGLEALGFGARGRAAVRAVVAIAFPRAYARID